MNKSIKQVYSVLKIDDDQLQLLTAEYFNTRFNVINTYVAPIEGIINYKIVDKGLVINAIKTAVDNASKKIGARIEKVVLVLPPYNFKKVSLKVSVLPTTGIIKKSDIARAITNSLKTNVDDTLTVINTSITKYTVNGISTRRMPENESCDEATVDIDLLCADKEMTYSFVETVYEAGLQVLDLTLNNYAIAKESVALDNSINQNTIILDIGNSVTYLSLLAKGRLVSSEIIYDGLNMFVWKIHNELGLPISAIPRLIKYSMEFNSNHGDDPVFAWNDDDKSNSINSNQLANCLDESIDVYIEKINTICKPIVEQGANFILCGEGSNINEIVSRLAISTNCEVKTYYPDTIGIRNTNLCALYGALYVYKDKAEINNIPVNCVNLAEYEKTVNQVEVDVEGESITMKIKNLFEKYKDREDI